MTGIPQPSRAAATAVIVRDSDDGPCDLLMVERSTRMAFAAGAFVFPGGGVDDADRALAQSIGGDLEPEEAAARIAAVRETLEESGLGVAFTRVVDAQTLVQIRQGLLEGHAFGDLLGARDIGLDLHRLIPFARWHPGPFENARRVYDTRFYLVRAPEGQAASADATETVHLFWSSAAEVIARCDAGNGHIIFPTRRNLERLAQFPSFDALAAHAASIPVEQISPWVEERDGQRILCIPTHLGYPVTSEPLANARRG